MASNPRTANSEAEDFAEVYRRTRDAGYSPEASRAWIRYLKR